MNLNLGFIKKFSNKIAGFIIGILLITFASHAKSFISFPENQLRLSKDITYWLDSTESTPLSSILKSNQFNKVPGSVINFAYQKNPCWLNFSFIAKKDINSYILSIPSPLLDQITLYCKKNNAAWDSIVISNKTSINQRSILHQYPAFNLPALKENDTLHIYLKVAAELQLSVPLQVSSATQFESSATDYNILIAIYVGIMLFMFLYNLFVYLSVRDKNYLYYVSYVLFIAIAQAGISGFIMRYIISDTPNLNTGIVVISSVISGIGALLFASGFLDLKKNAPILNKGLYVFYTGYVAIFLSYTFNYHQVAFQLLDLIGALVSIYALVFAIKVSLKNYRPAKFFLLAWSVFIAALILFILKSYSVIPSNLFTNSSLQWGSAFESLLLSFALADRINTLKKEKEASQAEALSISQENEKIIREQNVVLETKVTERTFELNETLTELKNAQTLLVESEKMSSLGQLTAGIAHEINNPINFVTSNISPLKRDMEMIFDVLNKIEDVSLSEITVLEKQQKINDLKQEVDFDYLKTEIDYLMKGISEGSTRTAEIVKGLRIFSRLDEDDLKRADINEGIDSTIIIVTNQLNNTIKINRNYGNIPLVDCYPGKLNQVFLNIISNSIYAIKARFGDKEGGTITISTVINAPFLSIHIIDNGVGMDENTKHKLFEPFFTTKPVGDGTGLGLSIVYNTIKKHNGNIRVNSTLGEGTEFIIEIPLVQQLS